MITSKYESSRADREIIRALLEGFFRADNHIDTQAQRDQIEMHLGSDGVSADTFNSIDACITGIEHSCNAP